MGRLRTSACASTRKGTVNLYASALCNLPRHAWFGLCYFSHRIQLIHLPASSQRGGARKAINELNNVPLDDYTVQVTQSRTAISPVDNEYLPQNDEEVNMSKRTVIHLPLLQPLMPEFCSKPDKCASGFEIPTEQVFMANVRLSARRLVLKEFVEKHAGLVERMKMVGDSTRHQAKTAFIVRGGYRAC